jgi:asparagine synthase (glutamine-hydrolysing)
LYLRVEDRNSMAHSVEARLPFLDYRLVTLSFSLPGEWKLRGGWNKYVVREALKGVIAEQVRTRTDKMGFPTPSKDWWGGPWYEPMMDLLGSRILRESGVCDVDLARTDLSRHAQGQVDVSAQLFRMAEFAAWVGLDPSVTSTARHEDTGDASVAALATMQGRKDQHA